jgi:hypothetical protein
MMLHKFRSGLLPIALGLLAAPVVWGQPGPTVDSRTLDQWFDRQRTSDDQLDQDRGELAPLTTFMNWQWGGWLEYYVFSFDDGIQNQRVLQRPALALWTRMQFDDGAHEIFARMRLNYDYFNPGDEYGRQQDWIGPNLDRGWYRLDVMRALRLRNEGSPVDLALKLGRQEVRFGTGYTLDLPMDAIQLEARVHDLRILGLLGKTISSNDNLIDHSAPVAGHMRRELYGVQLKYDGFDRHEPFVYALWNNDRTPEWPEEFYQNYAYDTRYFGFGSRGELVHGLAYWLEAVFESGHSYGDGQIFRRDRVEAWGIDAGVEKRWDHATRPRVGLEYMFGSGDAGRKLSPSSAAGGNRGDRIDTSFAGFGYRDTGIATNFQNSNLHLWRAAASFVPAPETELLKNLELGTNWFLFHKHHRAAAISDATADTFSGYVGWEMDYFANWRLSSELSWTLRWGTFFPGDAFSDRGSRHFLFTGLTWSF